MKAQNFKNKTITEQQCLQIVNWMPRRFNFGTWAHCFYCGVQPTDRDHVIPFSMTRLYERGGQDAFATSGPLVPSCHECNLLLSASYFDTLQARADFVNKRLRRRYSKLVHLETWADWEISEIKGKLRGHVVQKQEERKIAVNRVSWQVGSEFVADFESAYEQAVINFPENKHFHDFMRPRWL
jgi:hypothetical protein